MMTWAPSARLTVTLVELSSHIGYVYRLETIPIVMFAFPGVQ